MIRINQLTLPVDHGEEAIKKKAAKLLKVDESAIGEIRIVHRSIDARKKPQLLFSYIVDVMLANSKREGTVIKKAANQNIRAEGSRPYAYPEHGTAEMKKRPVIIGAGPAGIFTALELICRNVRGPGTLRERLRSDPFGAGRCRGGEDEKSRRFLEERG